MTDASPSVPFAGNPTESCRESVTAARVTAAFGPFRVAIELCGGGFEPERRFWADSPGLPADFTALAWSRQPRVGDTALRFDRLDADGFAFRTARSSGEGDWRTGRGAFLLDENRPDRPPHMGAALEAFFATGCAEVMRRGGVLLHAAVLVLDGRAWIVAGQSGAGKSTLAARFGEAHLQDEHAFLVPGPTGTWNVWRHAELRGPRGPRPWVVPVGGLLVLSAERAHTRVEPIEAQQALEHVMVHAYFVGAAARDRLFENMLALVNAQPPRRLAHCLADAVEDVARCIVGVTHAE